MTIQVDIIGAGVAGLTCAVELATRGVKVHVYERAASLGPHNCSWYAGGMLAPWCELESADPLIAKLGEESIDWWLKHIPHATRNGSLVIAKGRDLADLNRFATRTTRFERIDANAIAILEPDLADRFQQALYFADEAQINPREALRLLANKVLALNGQIHYETEAATNTSADYSIDCTGLAARPRLSQLRGVKGEMLLLRSRDVKLNRPIRLLHPRIPVYIVPRGEGVFMIGATMIESDDHTHISARSMMELLNAAYAVHPAFGEAEIIEIGTQVRPAFIDNIPRIVISNNARALHINGLYRHGYLAAPALARRAADWLLKKQFAADVMIDNSLGVQHADLCERQSA
jgi:glycine oxidase